MLREVLGYKVSSSPTIWRWVASCRPCRSSKLLSNLRAGSDVFLVCHSEEKVRSCYEAVVREAERDPAFAKQVERAAERVVSFKKSAPELRKPSMVPTKFDVERLRVEMADFMHKVAGSRTPSELAVAEG